MNELSEIIVNAVGPSGHNKVNMFRVLKLFSSNVSNIFLPTSGLPIPIM